jgi:ubiquinone/menaquinone biosynthesis C-methylase UbiE
MKTKKNTKQSVLRFWNKRAKFGQNAGTNDFMLKRLEERILLKTITKGSRVLDIGCGNASTLIRLAKENKCTGVGVDYADSLLKLAQKNIKNKNLEKKIQIKKISVLDIDKITEKFDIIYTQRCLINLQSKKQQQIALSKISKILKRNGTYFMLEAFEDGNTELNKFRSKLNLPLMDCPWHNKFFKIKETSKWLSKSFKILEINSFASAYYFLSRVIYAALAKKNHEPMRYDSEINKLSLEIPNFGEFGATKLIICKKI